MIQFRHIMFILAICALPLAIYHLKPFFQETEHKITNDSFSLKDSRLLVKLDSQLQKLSQSIDSQLIDSQKFLKSDVKKIIELQHKITAQNNDINKNFIIQKQFIENSLARRSELEIKRTDDLKRTQIFLGEIKSKQESLTENLVSISKKIEDISRAIEIQKKLIEEIKVGTSP